MLEADPEAKFPLHIAHWWEPVFVNAFFRFMSSQGVGVDNGGLSYFPSPNIGGALEIGQFLAVVKSLYDSAHVPVIAPDPVLRR